MRLIAVIVILLGSIFLINGQNTEINQLDKNIEPNKITITAISLIVVSYLK